MILIKPTDGLANRLRALDSAISLANEHQVDLYLLWELDSTCNSKFTNLFEKPDQIKGLIEIKRGFRAKILHLIAKLYFSKKFNNCYVTNFDNQKSIESLIQQKVTTKMLDQQNIHISTNQRFYYCPSQPPFNSINPKKSLQTIIDSYRLDHAIGVHIRRTDNKASIANSPVEKFIEAIKQELSTNSHLSFFLATDDPSVETMMKKTFKSKIIIHKKKSLDRNEEKAIEDAVVDLYCLAKCQKIIGSYWSSFSEVASEISGREVEIIQQPKTR